MTGVCAVSATTKDQSLPQETPDTISIVEVWALDFQKLVVRLMHAEFVLCASG